MNNFEFCNPVKLIFGQGEIVQLSKQIAKGTTVLMTYGGGSIKTNGVYKQVKEALKECEVIEFGGIEANPDYNTLIKAIEICKKQKVDIILAVGGGSIIDGTKFIAAGAKYDGDAWDIILNPALATDALPLASVLTLPATASEMNNGAVISRRERHEKFAFASPKTYPQFSILDPTVIYSLPKKQISNGIIDTFAHTLEQYLTTDNQTLVMDRWAEGLLQTLIELAPNLLKLDKLSEKQKYDTCANFMLTATMGLNGFIAMGVEQDWATHMIGHELTALHGLDHGVTLAIVHPGVMHVMRQEKQQKLVKYAERVWGETSGTDEAKIDAAIQKTEAFYNSLGVKTRLEAYGIGNETIATIVNRFKERNWNVGERGIVTPEKAEAILNCVKNC